MRPNFDVQATKIDLQHNPKTYHIPAWQTMNDKQKLDMISKLIKQYGRHPAVVKATMGILRRAGVASRDYKRQAAVLLDWVQNNIYYINEAGERLQSPQYTIENGYGDCDDMIILLLSFYQAIRLPIKLVISGKTSRGKLIRYHQGDRVLPQAQWMHIYGMVGDRPYTPKKWFYVEPTLKKPLGWDVVGGGGTLPELEYGSVSGSIATSAGAAATQNGTAKPFKHYLRDIVIAVVIGATTAVATQVVLDRIRVAKWYKKHIRKRQNRR